MEDERQRKIEAGREKLAAYKKRKSGEKRTDSEHSSLSLSDTSMSLSPLPLSDSKPKTLSKVDKIDTKIDTVQSDHSGSSSISENIVLSNSENDRSLQEIVIANIPLDSPDTSLLDIPNQSVKPNLSPNISLKSDSVCLNALENNNLIDSQNSQNILDEIIKHDQFDNKSDSLKSNALDDLSSKTLKSEQLKASENASQSELNMSNDSKSDKSRDINNKEVTIPPFTTDIDSLREVTSSNPSTISLGTNTTEYKLSYFDKVNLGAIEFQDILSNREEHIRQLTEALQQVLQDRGNLQEQTDHFAQEIADLKEQLIQTTAIIKKNNWNLTFGNEIVSGEKSEKCSDTKAQKKEKKENTIEHVKSEKLKSGVSEINFSFDDPEFDETLSPEEKKIVSEMRKKINLYIEQKVVECKNEYETELKILKDRLENKADKKININENSPEKVRLSPSKVPKSSENASKLSTDFDVEDQMFNETFTPEEINIIADLRTKIYLFIQQKINEFKNTNELELKVLQERLENEKVLHEAEIDRLRQLLNSVKSGSTEITQLREELNLTHNKEMEELRTYFEQRCAEMEKHYSEEIFSQQSRKMSASSECSELESEIYPNQPGPGGDCSALGIENPKNDLNSLRIDVQNKYHAELEILREDYENRLDELKINHENLVQDMEAKFLTQIEVLKSNLEEAQKNAVATQEVASSGDFEIAEVVESYERRLQEQVMLAKIDIISALEQQIQTLVSNTSEDLEWPSELLQLRDKLTKYWHKEIQEIKEKHAQEIINLKEEHEKNLARALERERRNSLRSGEEIEIKRERDNLKKVTTSLRHLVAELIKYFTKCEDELNNTLVEELLKYGFDKDFSRESDFIDTSQSGSDHCDTLMISPKIKRVHFTPDVSGIINLINNTSLENLDHSKDISTEFQTELNCCLERLKSEANAILALTTNIKTKSIDSMPFEERKSISTEDKITSLTRQLITETQVKNELTIQLQEIKGYVESLEAEKQSLELQVDQLMEKQQVLVLELDNAKEKINDLIESGRKEIVSEGYGENQITGATTLGGRIASLAELQDKARIILSEARPTTQHPLLQLIEELCREGDRIMEDAKKDHEDLVQQIEAADKKLRATTQFLEEQAVERELERDEAQRQLATALQHARDSERTRNHCQLINKEVERLEVQMKEMSLLMAECESKKTEVENELKEAIDKIWVLRDIIRDLEAQIEDKTKTEIELKNIVTQLEDKIREDLKQNEELHNEIHSLKSLETIQFNEHVRQLEAENQKLRVSSELVGPDGVLKQVKAQLSEIESTIERRTKELEALLTVVSNTNCSSPSEDMSLRDQVCDDVTNSAAVTSQLPLEQLARLQQRLAGHARAQDTAVKRIRDLEMHLHTAKLEYDEMQSERDVLQDQLSEQMVLISSLQLRLDEQRLRVEAVSKQTNTSLENKIYDLETEIQELKEAIHIRDKNVKQLNIIVEQTKTRIAEQQKQLNSASDNEKQINQLQSEIEQLKTENDGLRAKLQAELNRFQSENASLQAKIQADLTNNAMPELMESMLTDKNAHIDSLKTKMKNLEKELDFYNSLNLSKEQLSNLSKSLDSSSRKHSDILSNEVSIDQLRRQEQSFDSLHSSEQLQFKRNENETVFVGSSFHSKYADKQQHSPFKAPEISSIEKIGPTCVNFTVEELPELQLHSDSAASGDSAKQKHVHFDDHLEITHFESKINDLQNELQDKNETLKNYEHKIASMSDFVIDIEELRKKLEYSEETLRDTTENLKDEIESLKELEKDLRVELAEVKMELQQKTSKLDILEKDSVRKDQMYMNLAKEKRDLQNVISELEGKLADMKRFEDILSEKNKEIYELEQQLTEYNAGSTESLREAVIVKEEEINNLKKEVLILEQHQEDKKSEINALKRQLESVKFELSEKDEQLTKTEKDFKNLQAQFEDLSSHNAKLKDILESRNETIQQLENDLEKRKKQAETSNDQRIQELESVVADYKSKAEANNLEEIKKNNSELELEIARNTKKLAEKELQLTKDKATIEELQKEVYHLQDFLHEKDKIINQMTVDSDSLHTALEAIQSKMQESGNVLDLKKRLREEQSLTNALHEELKYLKQSQNERISDHENLKSLTESLEKETSLNRELSDQKEALIGEIDRLGQELEKEKEIVTKLQEMLDEQKQSSNDIQIQDANIIESMRLRLEAALDHENESEKLLEAEKLARKELEKQIFTLQQRTGSLSLDRNFKMNDQNFELTCTKMDLVKANTENEILKSELSTLKNINSLLKSELKQVKELSDVQKLEMNELKRRMGSMVESEEGFKEKYKINKREVQQRSLEIENSRQLMAELETERKEMKKQIEELYGNVQNLRQRERELTERLSSEREKQLNSPVPEKFLHKMKELTNLLQEHMTENKQMATTLGQLTEERKTLQARNKELEDRLNLKAPFDDPVARADHLFGRYLKSESYRKALIFQKRYLLTLLASYQKISSVNIAAELNFVLPVLTPQKKVGRFRIYVYVIISIRRMQYIVQRWHTGKRVGASAVLKRPIVPAVTSPLMPSTSTYVDSRLNSRPNSSPWSGNSPPSKERTNRRNELPLGNSIEEGMNVAPLQAPALLSQYIERFDSIQQRLGMALDNSST